MTEDSTLLRAVRGLDPQAARDEAPQASDELLADIHARIAAEAEQTQPSDVVPRPIPRRTRRILAGAAAAALVAVGITTVTSQSPPEAYASWSPTPTELRVAEVSQMSPLCTSPLPEPGSGGEPGPELTPVLAEARGEYEALVSVAEESTYSVCFGFPGQDAVREAASLPPGETFADPAPEEVHMISTATWQPLPDHGEITYAFGKAGQDVARISLSTENGSFAEASLSDGWWVVWFPEPVTFAGTLTVTTDDGAVHESTISADNSQH